MGHTPSIGGAIIYHHPPVSIKGAMPFFTSLYDSRHTISVCMYMYVYVVFMPNILFMMKLGTETYLARETCLSRSEFLSRPFALCNFKGGHSLIKAQTSSVHLSHWRDWILAFDQSSRSCMWEQHGPLLERHGLRPTSLAQKVYGLLCTPYRSALSSTSTRPSKLCLGSRISLFFFVLRKTLQHFTFDSSRPENVMCSQCSFAGALTLRKSFALFRTVALLQSIILKNQSGRNNLGHIRSLPSYHTK